MSFAATVSTVTTRYGYEVHFVDNGHAAIVYAPAAAAHVVRCLFAQGARRVATTRDVVVFECGGEYGYLIVSEPIDERDGERA